MPEIFLQIPDAVRSMIVSGSIVLLAFVLFIIGLTFLYSRKQNKHLRDKINMQRQFEEELLKTKMEIQEQTFQDISREIHDNLGQVASLIKINLHTVKLSDMEKAAERINETKDLVKQLIQDLKTLSVGLNGDRITQLGFTRAIEIEVERYQHAGVFSLKMEILGSTLKLQPEKEIILFRMFQEIMNNIIKHAAASKVDVVLHFNPKELILEIADNGKGFDFGAALKRGAEKGSNGLRNLQNRSRLINANMDLQSMNGSGTNVSIAVPL